VRADNDGSVRRLELTLTRAVGKLFVVPAWALPVAGFGEAILACISPSFLRLVPAYALPVPVKTGSTTATHQPWSGHATDVLT
jgi:hypothetical protein